MVGVEACPAPDPVPAPKAGAADELRLLLRLFPKLIPLAPLLMLIWLLLLRLWPRKRAGSGGTGGTSGDIGTGPDRGVPKWQSSMAAAKPASSSSKPPRSVDPWLSILDWRKWERAGESDGALPVKELDGTDWNERGNAEALLMLKFLWCPKPEFGMDVPSSPVGGGVVSVELRPFRNSSEPETVGEADEPSESFTGRFSGVSGSSFI